MHEVKSIQDLLNQISRDEILLPEFQRGYVWNRDQVRGLRFLHAWWQSESSWLRGYNSTQTIVKTSGTERGGSAWRTQNAGAFQIAAHVLGSGLYAYWVRLR